MYSRQKGMGAVGALVIIVVLGVLGAGGWYAWHHNKSTDTAHTKQSQQEHKMARTDPYDGWSKATLKYEQASFRYPSSWQVADTSMHNSDTVRLSGPDNFSMTITTGGLGHPSLDGPTPVLAAEPLSFIGQKAYFDLTSIANDGLVEQGFVSQSSSNALDTFKSKASGENETPGGNFFIYASYKANADGKISGIPLAKAKDDKNFQTALRIVGSIAY